MLDPIDPAPFNGMTELDYKDTSHPSREDLINNPKHYTVGGYEAIDVIKAKLTPEEYRGWLKGCALKYLMRANYKGHHDDDIHKAEFFIKHLGDNLESNEV